MIVVIALVKGNENSDETEVSKPIDHVKHTTPSGVKRWTPHYQKNIQRFTVTTKSTVPRTTPHFYKPSHKAVSIKVTPKPIKVKSSNFWKIAPTRRSFMKHMQFTMSPLSTPKSPEFPNNVKEIGRRYKSILFNKKDDDTDNDDSSEEISETININKQSKEKYVRSTISPFRRLRTKVLKSKTTVDNPEVKDLETKSQLEVTTKSTGSDQDVSSEELEDREEFIFVKSRQSNQNAVDIIKNDSIESEESTTVKEQETKIRRKR